MGQWELTCWQTGDDGAYRTRFPWPVRRQTHGYLPSHRASLLFSRYQIILLDDTCVWTTCPVLLRESGIALTIVLSRHKEEHCENTASVLNISLMSTWRYRREIVVSRRRRCRTASVWQARSTNSNDMMSCTTLWFNFLMTSLTTTQCHRRQNDDDFCRSLQ